MVTASYRYKKRKTIRIGSLLVNIVIIGLVSLFSSGIHAKYFANGGSRDNGFILNFVLQMKSNKISKPEGYSTDTIESILQPYDVKDKGDSAEKKPDIIVIMDESFSDLNNVGKLNTNISVTPYIDSLCDNTVKGMALTSVFGGGTPNSEYELLSGNSLLFLNSGTYVYSQFMHSDCDSMVSYMKQLGYKTIGMHPYNASGWNRDKVYSYLGFDETFFGEDFSGYDTVRDYISDKGMFQKIIELYEKSVETDESLFLFGVTMQNHGGYTYDGSNISNDVQLEGYSEEYSDVNQYLNLIHETDCAVQYLLEYLSQCDRDVVVLFYGDHLPQLSEEFYTELYGKEIVDYEEQFVKYEIPFFIWTNYESKEGTVELTSINYLSNFLYQQADINLPLYNRFLTNLSEEIPAMNSLGYFSKAENKFKKFEEANGIESELLNEYNNLLYRTLFDNQESNVRLYE